jgi:hypothetical protein
LSEVNRATLTFKTELLESYRKVLSKWFKKVDFGLKYLIRLWVEDGGGIRRPKNGLF